MVDGQALTGKQLAAVAALKSSTEISSLTLKVQQVDDGDDNNELDVVRKVNRTTMARPIVAAAVVTLAKYTADDQHLSVLSG